MPDSDSLLVSELFYSIQGESTRAGLPCAFVRLCGCNLRCSYCDSRYTWEEEGNVMSIGQVFAWLEDFPGTLVEITGGEPLLQETVYPLLQKLTASGREVLLETGGSLSIERVPVEVGIILDVKAPDSGMTEQNHWPNLALLEQRQQAGSHDEVKFVLCSPEDVAWAVDIVRQHKLTELVPVIFSPVIGHLPPSLLADLVLQKQLPIRLQLQLHTQIWPDAPRGV
ncbi:7-carboxy-7-deazaguanine synthase [Candidatus Electrothrix communis]|uniref:7-carboxy-7-deazaguanine synthase n=1 Tax=Candidatus Electrothrix communis TaxID=1859133 RepID=A0A3S3UDY2_9BACT|nr:7-carboxy-7-deazaguanine synthase [Candidatus Electrothrix communis]